MGADAMKTRMRPTFLLGLAVLALASPAVSQDMGQEAAQEDTMDSSEQATTSEAPDEAEAQQPPCSSPEHRQFDFWIGDWEVRNPDGELEGTNRVEEILGGCVLMENWEGESGSSGKSFNTYSAAHGEWKQFWVADAGYILELAGGLDDEGRMVLSGEAPSQREPGKTVLHEISWQALPDGTVRQHWRASRDGGETWDDLFVGIYAKKG
jgi:hypothetical protein